MIEGKKKSVTNRRFFTSRSFAYHLADIARAQSKRYGVDRGVKASIFWDSKNEFLACTDNNVITINAGHRFVTDQKGLENRYYMVLGLFSHELSHVLHTDFLSMQTYMLRLESGIWFPGPPRLDTAADVRNEAEIFSVCSKEEKNRKVFLQIAHNIWNAVEDAYIEGVMLTRYPGKLGHALSFLRKIHFESIPTLTEMIEYEDDGGHIFRTLLQLILSYAKFGKLKYGSEPLSDTRVQMVFSLLDDIDKAVGDSDPRTRFETTNIILVRLWPCIKDYIDQFEESEDIGDTIRKALGAISGATAIGKGNSEPAETPAGSESTTSSTENRKKTAAEAGAVSGDSGDSPAEAQQVQETETGRMEPGETHSLDAPIGGETEWDRDYAGSGYPNAASDIDRIVDKVAENLAMNAFEKQRTAELNQEAEEIEYGDIHAGVSKVIHRMSDIPENLQEAYDTTAPKLLAVSKHLQKTIKDQLQDKRKGGKQTGLYLGRRLDVHALPRKDGRIFYKNNLPNETPELAVGLLLDESGSMCSADRVTYARAAAVILHDFCVSMKIPVMVYGHSTGHGVDLYSYAEFDAYDNRDKYRLMDISARSSNRDGAALRFMMDRLKKRPEEAKLLILVSDGQPADDGYYGTSAEADLRGIKKDCDKARVLLVAAGIGDDKETLERIYGNSFMDITDLSQLPIKLAEKIKKYMKS